MNRELRIAFDPLANTGPISASSANVYGGGVGANWRNFLMQGEFYQIDVNQSNCRTFPRRCSASTAAMSRGSVVLTARPTPTISIGLPGAGLTPINHSAWQRAGIGTLKSRLAYSTVDLNSNVVPGRAAKRPGGIYGGKQQIGAVALNWYPNDWIRFMLQFQYVDVNTLNSAGKVQIGRSSRR